MESNAQKDPAALVFKLSTVAKPTPKIITANDAIKLKLKIFLNI